MTKLLEKGIEVENNGIRVITRSPSMLHLGIVSIEAQRSVMKDWEGGRQLPHQVHLGESLGQITTVLFGIVEVSLDLAVADIRIQVDLWPDLVDATGKLTKESSIVVTRGLDERRQSEKSER